MTGRRKGKEKVVNDSAVDHIPAVPVEKPTEATSTAETPPEAETPPHIPGRFKRLPKYYWRHKLWAIPLSIVVLLVMLMAIPLTRYKVVGLFVKGQLNVSVIDSSTNKPVSDASLYFGSASAKTAANGSATLKTLPLGNGTLSVFKQYYKTAYQSITVSYSRSHDSVTVRLSATGRQVPITVNNSITGKPVANAEIKVLNTSAKTDKQGQAIIVLPIGKQTLSGSVNANNFNDTNVTIQITTQTVPANTFKLTPSGRVYFLSNLSGKIDVVQTNLDGSSRQTIVPGTGNENGAPGGTTLYTSSDQKYLALLAQRKPTGDPELDLINTSTGKLSNIDEGNATFGVTGWVGDDFVYTVYRQNVPSGQSGAEAIKSFNANTGQLTAIDQSPANVSPNWPYVGQQATFTSINVINGKLIYSYNWGISTSSYWPQYYHGQFHSSVISVNPDGTNKKDLVDIPILTWSPDSNVEFKQVGIGKLIIRGYSYPMSPQTGGLYYYQYQNGQVSPINYTDNQFSTVQAAPTYFTSPSGGKTFWSTYTDGKNTLNVGDQNGQNAIQIAAESDYSPVGWYTDNYLLVSKNNDELYIMPVSGGSPSFISDFFSSSYQRFGYNYN